MPGPEVDARPVPIPDTEGEIYAYLLVPGAHQFRQPGSPEWLNLEKTRTQGDALHLFTDTGREFLTSPTVSWPARLAGSRASGIILPGSSDG